MTKALKLITPIPRKIIASIILTNRYPGKLQIKQNLQEHHDPEYKAEDSAQKDGPRDSLIGLVLDEEEAENG
jgi:hypothetical protein